MPTRPSPLLALALVSLAACVPDGPGTNDLLAPIDADAPLSLVVGSAVSEGAPVVSVRLVNTYQAAVPGTEATVEFGGDAEGSATVDLSASGAALVPVPLTAPGMATVTASASADGAETGASAMAWSTSTGLPRVQMSPTTALPDDLGQAPSLAAAGTGGLAFAEGQYVWWQPATPGVPATPIARLGFAVQGLQSAHIDADGQLDLVVFGGNELILLRGLGEAGFGWQGGWRAKEGDVVAVRAADLDGDRLTDLAVGVDRTNSGVAHVIRGDGQWGFTLDEPLELTHEIWSLTASNEDGAGLPVVSVLSAARGTVRRHTLTDEGWVGASDFELTGYEASAGAALLPQTDINGDGKENLIITGAPDASAQDFVFYDLVDGPTHYPLTFGSYYATLGDLDLDGATEMITVEDDELHVVRWDGEGFESQGFTGTGQAGPTAVGPWVAGDALPAVAIVTDAVTLHRGAAAEGTGAWNRDRFDWRAYNTALVAPAVIGDISGDGIGDILGFTTDPDLVLASWQLSQGDEGQWQILLGGKAELEGGDALDLVNCDGEVYALTGPEDNATLTRLRLQQNGATWRPVVVGSTPAAGSLLACGTIDTGEPGVVVADVSGFWTSYASGLGARSTGSVGATGAIALADTDGDGFGEVVGCDAEACSVAAGDLDGDGFDEVVRVADGIRVAWGDVEQAFPGTGVASLGDVDGDGALDVLVHDASTGRVQVLRTAGASSAWPAGWQTERPLTGHASVADMTGDGVPEIILSDAEGRVLHTGETDPTGSGW
jgi:hypothetical protein